LTTLTQYMCSFGQGSISLHHKMVQQKRQHITDMLWRLTNCRIIIIIIITTEI